MSLHLAIAEDHEAPPEAEEAPAGFEILPVSPSGLDAVWPRAAAFLGPAMERAQGQETLDDLREQCSDGRSQLWVVIGGREIVAAATTCLIDHPRYRTCRISYIGGSGLKEWVRPLDEALIAWARTVGCKTMDFAGRDGWARALKDLGYQHAGVICGKEI